MNKRIKKKIEKKRKESIELLKNGLLRIIFSLYQY